MIVIIKFKDWILCQIIKIFLAGASGVIGRTLSKLLVDDGWTVYMEQQEAKIRQIC